MLFTVIFDNVELDLDPRDLQAMQDLLLEFGPFFPRGIFRQRVQLVGQEFHDLDEVRVGPEFLVALTGVVPLTKARLALWTEVFHELAVHVAEHLDHRVREEETPVGAVDDHLEVALHAPYVRRHVDSYTIGVDFSDREVILMEMAYELSFSPEFFIGPHDLDGSIDFDNLEEPTSVYQALMAMPEDKFAEMAREVFGVEPDLVDIDVVMQKIRETNTCGDLRSPVDVWIDDEGYFTVDVYDSE